MSHKRSRANFPKLHKKTYFLGFTSPDCYRKEIPKEYSKYLHLAGASSQKGTQTILNVWKKKSDLPFLTLITQLQWEYPKSLPKNLNLIPKKIPKEDLRILQNQCGIHLCPSETEGFGHYIMESMSAGAVVITTNAPPMNEFILDPLCLVNYMRIDQQRLATNYYVDGNSLVKQIKSISKLSPKELDRIGKQNRQLYLQLKEEFYDRLLLLIP